MKYGVVECFDYMLGMSQLVWFKKQVPTEWRDALIIPIQKRGDLSVCDNWRSISLLDTTGKIFPPHL